MQYLGSAERQTEPYALASREKKYKRIAAYLSFWIVGYARVREPLSWTPGLYQYRCPWCHAWDRNSPSHVKSTFSYASPHLTVANESDMFGQKHVDWVYQMLGGDPIQTASCVFIQNRFFFFFFFHIIKGFFQFPACTLPNLELSEAQKLRGSREVSSRSQDTKPIDRIRTALTYIVDGSCRYRKEWSLASFQKRTQWNDTVSGTLLFLPYFFDHPVASLGPSEYKASRR